MQPTIMKFGGTSVEGATAFQNAARIVFERHELRPIVVVSAMSGFTDALLESVQVSLERGPGPGMSCLEKHFDRHQRVIDALLVNESSRMREVLEQCRAELSQLLQATASEAVNDKQRRRYFEDAVVSYGERMSSAMLAAVLLENKVSAEAVDARRCIITDNQHGSATPLMDQTCSCTNQELTPRLDRDCIPVMGGFIGSNESGDTTTLGRGGSDYTAAIVGAAVNAKEIQIWTDVPGVLTADPRVAPKAHTVPQLSFEEAAELAYFGAKVLHPKTLYPAIERNIPVRICNSRSPESGSTLVLAETEKTPQTVKAIAHKTGVTTVQVTSARMLGAFGFLRALFEIFDRHRTAVDVVTTSEVSVSLSLDDTSSLPAIVEELKLLGSVSIEGNRAILCSVGEGLRSTPGIAARIFSTISNINVSLISQGASRINLTFAVEESRAREAVMRLHKEFFEQASKIVEVEHREVASEVTT